MNGFLSYQEEDFYWIRVDHSPHALPCEHSICRKCLKERMSEEEESFKITCPVCDERHILKDASSADPSSIYPGFVFASFLFIF